ncbi:MAG: glycosyltransferase family 2 protein [Thermoleophilia bacterium]|nr:glycosyltransferase family 2 protein [Thermoleophilia bacterium]
MRYAIVTPVRDEVANLERIASCVASQTARPEAWVLVENGSTDETPDIAARLADEHTWVHVLRAGLLDAEERGAPIVHAFHLGVSLLQPRPEVIVQLDADLSFPPYYFEQLLRALGRNVRLGIVSGTCYEQHGGEWREQHVTGASVWGAARAYRKECLERVLPLEPRTGWDAVDVAEANALGWETRILHEVPFYHHRREASRERTRWSAWAAQGRVSHFLGYRPSYLLLRALFRAFRDPAALALVAGYAGEAVRRRPQCAKPGVRTWVRKQQRLRNLARRVAEARGVSG